jgi:hypothetical protein
MNYGWNGSTLSFGGGVTPLLDLRQPNEPEEFDTTGSADTAHTHGTGLNKNSFSARMLGSRCPIAGTCCAIASSIGAPSNKVGIPATKSFCQAIITQLSISGRKNGPIESNATMMPGDTILTATTQTWTPAADLGFNGSSFSFGSGSPFTGLMEANYSSSATPIPSVGAEGTGGSPPTDELFTPGLPDETLTITCLGAQQCNAKAVGTTTMTWNDGGSAGTFSGSNTAECMSTRPGGSIDGQATTEYVFKLRRSGSGND